MTGCSMPAGSVDSSPSQTQSASPASTADIPSAVPRPSADCTVTTLPAATYPALSSSNIETTATEFALAFEKAYAPAELQAERGVEFSGFDGWDSSIIENTSAGYIVRTRVALDFSEDSSDTVTVMGSTDSTGWYYVTDTYAARASGGGEEQLPTTGWEIVVCAIE